MKVPFSVLFISLFIFLIENSFCYSCHNVLLFLLQLQVLNFTILKQEVLPVILMQALKYSDPNTETTFHDLDSVETAFLVLYLLHVVCISTTIIHSYMFLTEYHHFGMCHVSVVTSSHMVNRIRDDCTCMHYCNCK